MTTSSAPTPRQLEVLRARCETGSRKEAAAVLGSSPETVRWHLTCLFGRCGCVDEAQAGWRHHEELLADADGRGRMVRVRRASRLPHSGFVDKLRRCQEGAGIS